MDKVKYMKQLSNIGHQAAQDTRFHNKCTKNPTNLTKLLMGESCRCHLQRGGTQTSLVFTLSSGNRAGSPVKWTSLSLQSRVLDGKELLREGPGDVQGSQH